ncbi:MAG: hypothetical protein KJ063_23075 [Anaerolineae bacterium]|nr:hypothetical protein [Anaerolineae bacterium]
MKKQNPWFMILIVVLTLAALACTCTSSIPNIGSDSSDSGSDSGNSGSSNSGDSSSGDSGSSGNSGNSSSDSGGSSDSGSSGSARMVRGLPVMGDASNQFDVEAMGTTTVSFSTKNSIRDVVAFYKKEIGAMGYSLLAEAVQESANTAALTFETSDRFITVGVAPDPLSSGSLTVAVSSTPK